MRNGRTEWLESGIATDSYESILQRITLTIKRGGSMPKGCKTLLCSVAELCFLERQSRLLRTLHSIKVSCLTLLAASLV